MFSSGPLLTEPVLRYDFNMMVSGPPRHNDSRLVPRQEKKVHAWLFCCGEIFIVLLRLVVPCSLSTPAKVNKFVAFRPSIENVVRAGNAEGTHFLQQRRELR